MTAPDADRPPPNPESTASHSVRRAGCAIVSVLALLPLLYLGSFALLFADVWFGWGLGASLDSQTVDVINVIYWPLILLADRAFDLLEIQP